MFITKKKHNLIVKEKEHRIEHLEKSLAEAQNLKFVFEALINKSKDYLDCSAIGWVSGSSELVLPDHVPVYVDDYFGGKVIKQEATPVTILDENGKATYGLTKKTADKGKKYLLIT